MWHNMSLICLKSYMYQLFQTFSTIVFFGCYYYYDIYVASLTLSILSAVQLLFSFVSPASGTSFERFSLSMLTVFGLSTWYFHNPLYIQWKVSIMHALISVFILFYIAFQKQSLFAGVLRSQNIIIPETIGFRADQLLAAFMFSIAIANFYVFKMYDEYTWVLFKTSLIFVNLVFLFILAMYLGQYMKNPPKSPQTQA